MKISYSLLGLSSAVVALGIAIAPLWAQQTKPQFSDKCPAQVSAEATGPQAINYSWGVEIVTGDNSSRKYTWAELANFGKAEQPTRAAEANAVLNGPDVVKYSWGVQVGGAGGMTTSYTWAMLDQLRGEKAGSVGAIPPYPYELQKQTNYGCD